MSSDQLTVIEAVRHAPSTAAVIVDYDGTLSAIVDDPSLAVPANGAVSLLEALSERYGLVMIVSGRPLAYLQTRLPRTLSMVGLYGLEGWTGGERWEHPNGGAWRECMADLAVRAEAHGPKGMRVELKDLSITLHYRGIPDLQPAVEAYAIEQARSAGLHARPARMSMELQPPIGTDKGTVIERFCAECTAVLFAGDDLGDLPAFDALDRLARQGLTTVKVAVGSDEAPPLLVSRADLVVKSPDELVTTLQQLL